MTWALSFNERKTADILTLTLEAVKKIASKSEAI
jgi:hypothetical protein